MDTLIMMNVIALIKKIYQVSDDTTLSLDVSVIETAEQQINKQLPALLFHYYRELGGFDVLNTACNHVARLPLQMFGDYVIVAKEPDGEAIWGIHQDDLNQSNPPVMVSRNHDMYDIDEVHWINEADLSKFLLAQAIFNGVNGGLKHYAQVFDFIGDTIPSDIIDKLTDEPIGAVEIDELKQSHQRFFEIGDWSVVVMLSLGDNGVANGFYIGGQDTETFSQVANQLTVAWDSLV